MEIMKTTIVRLSVVLITLCGLCACGGSSTKITMTNEDCECSGEVLAWGDVDDFFEVVPGVYTISEKDGKLLMPVTVVKTKNEKLSRYAVEGLVCSLGSDIDHDLEINGKDVEFYACDKFASYRELCNCSVGEKVTIPFEYLADETMLKAVKAALTSECKIREICLDLEDEEDDDASAKVSKSKSSSTNWDAILDEYESFVDKYIALAKKASAGDISALTEYAEYMEKAEDLADDLEDAEDEMTAAQIARYSKISMKLTNAVDIL